MILDIDECENGRVWTTDICIVGAGAAGIALALEFVEGSTRVLLLEAGGEVAQPNVQSLYEGTVEGTLHSPPDRYRQRRFGGTTTIWGGRCMPFDPVDFEARPWISHSGWPIGIDAIAPFYPKANRLCEAGDYAYTAARAFDRPLRPMIDGLRSTHFTIDTLERFSCPTDFGARYGHKLRASRNVDVLLNANVTALRPDPACTTIESLTVRTLAGKSFGVKARRFVLAMGGLEIPRLLLASTDRSPGGIGNRYDVVGRYYMCHLAGSIGDIAFAGPSEGVWHGYDIADDGVYCRRRIALAADTQRREGLGNFVGRLHHPRITDPAHRTGMLSLLTLARVLIPYEYGKRLHGDEKLSLGSWARHVRNVLLDPFGTLAFVWHHLTQRKLAIRKFPTVIVRPRANRYSLDFHAEQFPSPESRVTLAPDRDALGVPKLHIDWRYSREDVASVTRTLKLLAADLRQDGVATFSYDPETVETEMTRYGAYGGHHIGTTRMGSDPRTSVVDADCRVHGMNNLFVASSSVFPTSSQANPTLTIVALALRLADYLKASFERRGERPSAAGDRDETNMLRATSGLESR